MNTNTGNVEMNETKIEWADKVWNPVTGCTKISIGCQNCYAERMAKRLAANHTIAHPERYEDFKVSLHPERLDQPLHWKKPCRVFVCSMGDLFHDNVPFEFIAKIWRSIFYYRNHFQHTFQVLTKRPERMREFVKEIGCNYGWLPNVWLGVSVSNQEMFDKRWRILRDIPAAVLYISHEPALGPLVLPRDFLERENVWVICGAETGPGARHMKREWAYDLGAQVIDAGIPFFFKKDSNGNRELDGQLWEQFPQQIKEVEK